MRKFGLILVVIVLALGTMGLAYSQWTETPFINGVIIAAGNVECEFFKAVSNDASGLNDPAEIGTWSYSEGGGTIQGWTGMRKSTDGASTAATVIDGISIPVHGQTLHIVMNGAYAGYRSSVGAIIKNTGTIPVRIQSVVCTVTPVGEGSPTDVSVTFTGALLESNHALIGAGGDKQFGSINFYWNSVPNASSVYALDVTITAGQGMVGTIVKKIGLICVVLLAALGGLGVGYAQWTHTLAVTGELRTAAPSANFLQVVSNDAGDKYPSAKGSWAWLSGALTGSNWSGTRQGSSKYKGYTTVQSGTGSQTLVINVSNESNPDYYSSVGFTIKNTGASAVKVTGVTVTPAAGLQTEVGGVLVVNNRIGGYEEKLGWVNFHLVSSTTKTYTVSINYTLVAVP